MNYLPEIEKIHKKKEKLLKKQQREALLLDSYLTTNGFTSGRSRRERKRVTYTFDDYDRSINEAIKTTKAAEIATATNRRVLDPTQEASGNGRLPGPSPLCNGFYGESPVKSHCYQTSDKEKAETLHRRQRKRSQRYTKDFVEALSDIDSDFDSDDDIMGEAVYDEEYLRSRKQHKASLPKADEEFRLEQVATDGDDEVDHSFSASEDADELHWYRRLPQEARLRSVDEIQKGIRRSKRSTRPRINHRQYDISVTDTELVKPDKCNASDPDAGSDAPNDMELSTTSQDREEEDDEVNKARHRRIENVHVPGRESRSVGNKFLDLNALAPVGGFGATPVLVKENHMNNG